MCILALNKNVIKFSTSKTLKSFFKTYFKTFSLQYFKLHYQRIRLFAIKRFFKIKQFRHLIISLLAPTNIQFKVVDSTLYSERISAILFIIEKDTFFKQFVAKLYFSFLYSHFLNVFRKYTHFIKIRVVKIAIFYRISPIFNNFFALNFNRSNASNGIMNLDYVFAQNIKAQLKSWNAFFFNYIRSILPRFVTYFRDFLNRISLYQLNEFTAKKNSGNQAKFTCEEVRILLQALNMIKLFESKHSRFALKKRKEFNHVRLQKMLEIQKIEHAFINSFSISSIYSRRTWFFMRKFFNIRLKSNILYIYKGISKHFFTKFPTLNKVHFEKKLFKTVFATEVKRKLKYLVFLFLTWKANNVFFTFSNIFGKTIYKASGGYWKNNGKSRRLLVHIQKLAQKIGERLVKNFFSFYIIVGLQHIKTRMAKAVLRGFRKARLICLGRIIGKNNPTSLVKLKKKRRL